MLSLSPSSTPSCKRNYYFYITDTTPGEETCILPCLKVEKNYFQIQYQVSCSSRPCRAEYYSCTGHSMATESQPSCFQDAHDGLAHCPRPEESEPWHWRSVSLHRSGRWARRTLLSTGMHMLRCTCGRRATCGSQFSPSATWTWGGGN